MYRPTLVRSAVLLVLLVTLVVLALGACGGAGGGEGGEAAGTKGKLARVVEIEGGRGLYVRCTGTGSPTVLMEAGDGDTSDQYAYAEEAVAEKTRSCVYDRANLGRSDPAPGPRQLPDLVGDLEKLFDAAEIPGPYVLVGTSGGGYIISGYAYELRGVEDAGAVLRLRAHPLPLPREQGRGLRGGRPLRRLRARAPLGEAADLVWLRAGRGDHLHPGRLPRGPRVRGGAEREDPR